MADVYVLLSKFSKLEFNEEDHIYTVNGEVYPSVSGLIENFYDKFNPELAYKYADSRGFLVEQVQSAWDGEADISIIKGNRVHNYSEDYINNYIDNGYKFNNPDLPTCKQELGCIQWWHDTVLSKKYPNLEPLVMELRMYNEKFKYAGTADIILLDKSDGSLIIGDLKTNKDIFKSSYGQNLKNPFSDLEANPFNKYQLQFSYYQILLEEMGYNVKARVLIWLNQDEVSRKLYKQYRTKNFTKDLRKTLIN